MHSFKADARCPLDGVTVVDLSRLVAGNMLSLQLADFGAEVIKVEDPVKGDPLREWKVEGISIHWKVYARGKKSLSLSLRKHEGKEILLALAAKAQVLIENYRPGMLEQIGLGPEVLHARNPALVIVRISGWGQDGPYAQKPGYGTLVEGMSGYAAKNGFPDREPLLPPTALADMIAGLYGMSAVLIALRECEVKGGKGQIIDLPLLDPMHSIIGPDAAIYRLTGRIPERQGSRSSTACPRNVFRTRDGRWIAISASMQSMAERLYAAVGRPDLNQDPRFASNSARLADPEAAERPIREFIGGRDLEDCLAVFAAAEVTAAPVYDIDQFLDDPHVKARQVVVELPDEEIGSVPMHDVIPRLSVTPGAIRAPAPKLGEHTEEILARIGIDKAGLERLRRNGVV
jgi:crotonobetainyl-CoA:carnitine CoA-transferase CaiB-like acyl-CoA transferase